MVSDDTSQATSGTERESTYDERVGRRASSRPQGAAIHRRVHNQQALLPTGGVSLFSRRGRLKAKNKSVTEAEGRVRNAASRARLVLMGERGGAEAGGHSPSSPGAGRSERPSAGAARPAAAAAAAGGLRGWEMEGHGAGNGSGSGSGKEVRAACATVGRKAARWRGTRRAFPFPFPLQQ